MLVSYSPAQIYAHSNVTAVLGQTDQAAGQIARRRGLCQNLREPYRWADVIQTRAGKTGAALLRLHGVDFAHGASLSKHREDEGWAEFAVDGFGSGADAEAFCELTCRTFGKLVCSASFLRVEAGLRLAWSFRVLP